MRFVSLVGVLIAHLGTMLALHPNPNTQETGDKPIQIQLKIIDDKTGKLVRDFGISSGSLASDGKLINWWQGVSTKIVNGYKTQPTKDGINISIVPTNPKTEFLRVVANGYLAEPVSSQPLGQLDGHMLSVRLKRGEIRRLKIFENAGGPLEGAKVFVLGKHVASGGVNTATCNLSFSHVMKTTTDENGECTISAITQSTNRIGVVTRGKRAFVFELNVPKGRQHFKLPKTGSLKIVATPANQFANETVGLRRVVGNDPLWRDVHVDWKMPIVPGKEMIFTDVPGGSYQVTRSKSLAFESGNVTRLLEVHGVTIVEEQQAEIAFVRTRGSKLFGKVNGLANHDNVGAVISFTRVQENESGDEPLNRNRTTDEVVGCDQKGLFKTGPMRPGKYSWHVEGQKIPPKTDFNFFGQNMGYSLYGTVEIKAGQSAQKLVIEIPPPKR